MKNQCACLLRTIFGGRFHWRSEDTSMALGRGGFAQNVLAEISKLQRNIEKLGYGPEKSEKEA